MAANGIRDNRQAVRVTSRILFFSKPVSKKEFAGIVEDFNNGISLYNRENISDAQIYVGAQTALSRIKDKDEDLASVLQHIDGKINVILSKIENKPSILDQLTLQTVCLGGNGIAFWSDNTFAPKELLEMRFLIKPDHIFIDCFGSVVTCTADGKANQAGKNRVSVKFELIMDEDREALIQYNFRQQSLALKRRRETKFKQA